MGQWINRCDPLSTLMHKLTSYLLKGSLAFAIPVVVFDLATVTELFVDVMFTKNSS